MYFMSIKITQQTLFGKIVPTFEMILTIMEFIRITSLGFVMVKYEKQHIKT